MVHTAFTDVLLVDLDREGTVAFTDQYRRTEVGHCPQEDHQGDCQDRRHTEGQNDFGKALETGALQILRCFHQRLVDTLESAADIEVNEREQFGRHDQNDTAETVDAWRRHIQDIFQECGDRASSSEQQDPGIGADERSRHGAEDRDDLQEQASLQFIDRVRVGEQDTEEKRSEGDYEGDLQAVDEGIKIIGITEETDEMRQRELMIDNDRVLQDIEQRINDE